jgi:hypothetical protein
MITCNYTQTQVYNNSNLLQLIIIKLILHDHPQLQNPPDQHRATVSIPKS